MTIEELLRAAQPQTAENGFVYAALGETPEDAQERDLAKLVATLPRTLVPRLGHTACYFVPWLLKQRRTVHISLEAPEPDSQRALCHHLDVKPAGNFLLISLRFYEHDSYGLAMEFFDKVAYLALLESEPGGDLEQVIERHLESGPPGELTPETWEWRTALSEAGAEAKPEARRNYLRAAATDALGLYLASMYTDIFYEDLFEPEPERAYTPLEPELVAERVRAAERMFPPNRGYSLQVVRQRPRRRRPNAAAS